MIGQSARVVPGRSPATVRRRKSFGVKRGSQPCQWTVPPPTICGTGQNSSTPRRLVGCGLAPVRGLSDRVGPEIVAVDVGELVAAEALALAPRAALQRHDLDARLASGPWRPRRRRRRRR